MLRSTAIALAALGLTAGTASADPAPPKVVGLAGTPVGRVERALWFEWGSDQAGVTYTCRFDNGEAKPCTSPLILETDEGVHTLSVTPANAAGVTGQAASASVRVVDTHIAGGPASGSYTSQTSASFKFEGGSSYTCNLDGAGEAPCTSQLDLRDLADGEHRLYVRAHYDAVAYDRLAAAVSWNVDTVAPETTLTGDTPPFSFTASEPATFRCSIDGQAWRPCATPAGLAGGFHAFEVKAIDRAGNEDPAPAQRVWFVRGPLLPVTTPTPTPTAEPVAEASPPPSPAPPPPPVATIAPRTAEPGLAWRYRKGRFTRLEVTGLPAGTTLTVIVTAPHRRPRTLNSLKPLIGKRLAPGTKIAVAGMTITIRRPPLSPRVHLR